MLAIFSEDAELARRTVRRLEDVGETEVFDEWIPLGKRLDRADLVVVAAPDPDRDLFARMQAHKGRAPSVPFILVTRRDPDALRRLTDLSIEEVVWADELDEELFPALRRAEGERRFREYERRLRAARHLSPTLVAALARALRRRPPLASVRSLAAEVDRDRRTVWHHWREAYGEKGDLTPKGFLDWVLLLRAAVARTPGTTWRRVARDVGVHTRTLRRVADRRLDATLDEVAEIAGRDVEALFRRFSREVLEPLTVDGPTEAAS